MTIHEILFTPARESVMLLLFLLLTAQLAFVIIASRDARSMRVKLSYMVHLAVSFAVFYVMMFDICWDINYPGGVKPLPDGIRPLANAPVSSVILYEALTAAVLFAEAWELYHYRKSHLTAGAIKETLDLLPAGIAFGKEDGTVVFSNLTMNDLARKLTGKGILNLVSFREAVAGNTGDSPANNPDSNSGHGLQISLPDGSGVWQFVTGRVDAEGEDLVRLTATDITEQARITEELELKNKKLRDIHMRLGLYNKQADRIIMAQELLTARMAVHNEVGNILLESRHYLKDPSSIDEEMLLQALKDTNTYLLREYEEDDTARDPLTDALEMAGAIGVKVKITGSVPEAGTAREILAAAINECATNTVKHADGDRLSVEVRQEGSGQEGTGKSAADFCFILQSSGSAGGKVQPGETMPAKIHESGGLRSLRTLVEQENGTMRVESTPEFRLVIRLKSSGKQVL